MTLAYYNEHDPFAAQWLMQLIADDLIAPGVVDTRSIEDVTPHDLDGFTQCHFFAGIGVWSLAARLAGWPDDRPLWSGSCPCQPFSAAGKGGGFDDERHLWPAMHWLVDECRPAVVVGEQVASRDGLAWLDLVSSDMEGAGYAFGAVDTCAAGFGAPHIRQRLYWLADAGYGARRDDRELPSASSKDERAASDERRNVVARAASYCLADDRLADAGRGGIRHERPELGDAAGCTGGEIWEQRIRPDDRHGGDAQRLADSSQPGLQGRAEFAVPGAGRGSEGHGARRGDGRLAPSEPAAGPTNGFWRDADWLYCRDEKWRPVMPDTFPLADAGAFRNRVGLLRGAGNAVNVAQAAGFMRAVMACV